MARYILAIDQGTSGSKSIVFDTMGRIVAKATMDLKSSFPKVGYVEQDPEEIYRTVIEAVKQSLQAFAHATSDPVEAIEVCGISNQRETFMVWSRDCKPIAPAVVWQCKRSVDVCNGFKEQGLESEVSRRTGLILNPYFSGTKVVALYRENDAVKKSVDAGEAMFGTVDAWLLYKLTGGASYRTDHTNACRTLLFNIDDLDWDRSLLEKFGLSNLQLPEVLPSSAPFGETDFEGLLPKPIQIGGMIGDSHASAFGQGCFSAGSAKVTMGTGSSILMNTGKRSNSEQGMMSTICWSTSDRVDYALEGIIVSCASSLTWLREQLGLCADVGEMEPAARSVESNAGVYLIPAFAGMGAPYWKMEARAQIVGLTFGATKNHVLRAGLESIAYQIKDIFVAMEADSGVGLREIVADGGTTKNGFVMQLLADLLGVPVVLRGIGEVSALGAACMAGLQAGIYKNLDDLKGLESKPDTFEPGHDKDNSTKAYEGWQEIMAGL